MNRTLPGVVILHVLLFLAAADALGQQATYESQYQNAEGTELIAVYIGSNTCGPCHDPKLKVALEKMKILLADRAASEGRQFSAIGVAKGYSVEDGLDFLNATGVFDEIVVGRSWHNSAVVEHVWREGAMPAMPQVVILEQEVTRTDSAITFGEKRYVARFIGGQQLIDWVEAGAPLVAK